MEGLQKERGKVMMNECRNKGRREGERVMDIEGERNERRTE